MQVAQQRVAEQNRSFSEETAVKQQERLDAMSEKKDANIKGLQERLRQHVRYSLVVNMLYICQHIW